MIQAFILVFKNRCFLYRNEQELGIYVRDLSHEIMWESFFLWTEWDKEILILKHWPALTCGFGFGGNLRLIIPLVGPNCNHISMVWRDSKGLEFQRIEPLDSPIGMGCYTLNQDWLNGFERMWVEGKWAKAAVDHCEKGLAWSYIGWICEIMDSFSQV